MSDMNHVNDGRTDAHLDALDALDAAELWQPEGDNGDGFPLSYDEWLAARLANGQPAGEFDEYLEALGQTAQEPGACPFCGGNIRGLNWFYHCDGCGFNWSNLEQINFDRAGVESRNGTA